MFDRIGRYRVERRLGSGAFATVWLAVDESLDAQLAIKVLAENWMHDEDVRRRFSEEARILWRLDSDRIIRVHAVDELPDGRPYFVMDFADGGNLADRMRDRAQAAQPYAVDEAVGISIAVAEGLAVAHSRGIVHRDLKPSNVMFRSTSDGERVVLADFGIARSLEAAGATTISAGTPHYMAPEQAEGRADRGSDVYAAAVVLYELLAGTVPFPFPTAGQVMRAQMTGAAPDVRAIRPEVSAGLAAAVARGLSIDPAGRFSTAEAWRDAIRDQVPPTDPGPTPPPALPVDAGATMGPAELAQARATAPTAPMPLPLPPTGGPPPTPPTPPPAGPPPGPAPRRKRRRAPVVFGILAVLALIAVVAGIAAVSGGKASADELYRDPAASAGLGPFMGSLVPPSLTPPDGTAPSVPPLALPEVTLPNGATVPGVTLPSGLPSSIPGTTPGLYGGTRQLTVCDAKAMVDFLQSHTDKAAAWAGALGIAVDQIPTYVSGLTDAILRSDTRVTNHSFVNGEAQPKQSVLQAGTAVLVDAFGIPRVRCFCGNPLLPPKPVTKKISYTGPGWTGFSPTNITVIVEGPRIDKLVLVDVRTSQPFARPQGTAGPGDVDAPPPPSAATTTSSTAAATTTTTVAPTSTTAASTPVDITREGAVSASSTFSGAFGTALAIDGDPSTSWFSKGDADGPSSTFTWQAKADALITSVAVLGNSSHANPSFRKGQGFRSSKLEVLNAAGAVVFTSSFAGPGDAAPNLSAEPNVVGRTIRLTLVGHVNPQCGGFSELNVQAVR
jgi:serine/threonine protein kinase